MHTCTIADGPESAVSCRGYSAEDLQRRWQLRARVLAPLNWWHRTPQVSQPRRRRVTRGGGATWLERDVGNERSQSLKLLNTCSIACPLSGAEPDAV